MGSSGNSKWGLQNGVKKNSSCRINLSFAITVFKHSTFNIDFFYILSM